MVLDASPFSFSDIDVGDAFQFINHIMAERRRNITGRSGVVVIKGLECQYNFKAEIGVQIINHIIAESRQNTTGRGGVLVGRWRSKP